MVDEWDRNYCQIFDNTYVTFTDDKGEIVKGRLQAILQSYDDQPRIALIMQNEDTCGINHYIRLNKVELDDN
jgi:hypothetical protein